AGDSVQPGLDRIPQAGTQRSEPDRRPYRSPQRHCGTGRFPRGSATRTRCHRRQRIQPGPVGEPVSDTTAPADTGANALVVVRTAVKRFGATTALNDLSITIRQGESHGLLGRNGAGKSTLVATLTGLHALDSGSLEFDGQPAPSRTDRAAWLAK